MFPSHQDESSAGKSFPLHNSSAVLSCVPCPAAAVDSLQRRYHRPRENERFRSHKPSGGLFETCRSPAFEVQQVRCPDSVLHSYRLRRSHCASDLWTLLPRAFLRDPLKAASRRSDSASDALLLRMELFWNERICSEYTRSYGTHKHLLHPCPQCRAGSCPAD